MADTKAMIGKQILLFGMSLGPENHYQLVGVLAPKRQSIWSSLRSNSEKLVNRFICRAGGPQDQIDPDGHDLIRLHNSILGTRKSGKGYSRTKIGPIKYARYRGLSGRSGTPIRMSATSHKRKSQTHERS
jgi:hypothetical protein